MGYERLQAKAKAKDRGEDVNTSWTPRPSPLRRCTHDWRTSVRAPPASPALPSGAIKGESVCSGVGLRTPKIKCEVHDFTLPALSSMRLCSPVEPTPTTTCMVKEEVDNRALPSSAHPTSRALVASTPRG